MVTRSRLKSAGTGSSKNKKRLGRVVVKKYTVYKFDELPKETQQKVLDKHRDINTDYDWWDYIYDSIEHDFREKYGIEVDQKKISFSAERGREWYLSIGEMSVSDWKKFMKAVKKEANLNGKELKNIDDEGVIVSFPEQRENFNDVSLYPTERATLTVNEQWALQKKLADWLEEKEEKFLKDLEEGYDYNISDESVADTLRANDYEFTKDGEME